MPLVKVSCFCGSSTGQSNSTEWISTTACGHIMHRTCLEQWFRSKKHKECPTCRDDMKSITRKVQGGIKQKHPFHRLYFDSDVRSDPESQFSQLTNGKGLLNKREEVVVDEIEDESDEEDHDAQRGTRTEETIKGLQARLKDSTRLVSELRASLLMARLPIPEEVDEDGFTETNRQEMAIEELTIEVTSLRRKVIEFEGGELNQRVDELELQLMAMQANKMETKRMHDQESTMLKSQLSNVRKEQEKWIKLKGSYDKRMSKEGTMGAQKLLQLKADSKSVIDKLEERLKVANEERNEALEKLSDSNRLHVYELAQAKGDTAASIKLSDHALESEKKAIADLASVKHANERWRSKYEKLKFQYERVKFERDDLRHVEEQADHSSSPLPIPAGAAAAAIRDRFDSLPAPPLKLNYPQRSRREATDFDYDSQAGFGTIISDEDRNEQEDRKKRRRKQMEDEVDLEIIGQTQIVSANGERRTVKRVQPIAARAFMPLLNSATRSSTFGPQPVHQPLLSTDKHLPNFAKPVALGHPLMRIKK